MWDILETLGYGDPWSVYAWRLVERHIRYERSRVGAPPRRREYDPVEHAKSYQRTKEHRYAKQLQRIDIEREHKRKTWERNRERYNAARRAKAAAERAARGAS